MVIVAFEDAHLSAIADFWVASWAKTMPAIDFEARRPWILAHLPGLRDKGVAVRVALDRDEFRSGWTGTHKRDRFHRFRAGFMAKTAHTFRHPALGETGAPIGFITVDPRSGHIDQVCVSPDHWGGGLAGDLITEAKRIAPAGLHLDVNADNPRAIAFYVRHGFRETGRGANPTSGLPIIAMEWTGE